MRVRSTKKLAYQAGREGTKTAIIEIEERFVNKDEANKTITFSTTDYAIVDETTGTTPTATYSSMNGKIYINSETKVLSYTEYDTRKATFVASDTSELTGLELEDAIQQAMLLDTVSKGKFYSSAIADWAVYVDPTIPPETSSTI